MILRCLYGSVRGVYGRYCREDMGHELHQPQSLPYIYHNTPGVAIPHVALLMYSLRHEQRGTSPTADPNGKCTRRPIPMIGLSRGRQSVRGFAVKQAIILMKCETHMSNTEIAEALGLSRQWVARVWRAAVREAEQAAIDPEKREELQAWLFYQLEMIITKAQSRVDESAAYGALVLKGVEQMRILLGIDNEVDNGGKSTLHEIAKQVEIRSPLVMAKLDRVTPVESGPTG
jgi:hypothetical protein